VSPRTLLDLDKIKFLQGGHFMANRKTIVPEGAWRTQKKGYEEVHVPATKVRSWPLAARVMRARVRAVVV